MIHTCESNAAVADRERHSASDRSSSSGTPTGSRSRSAFARSSSGVVHAQALAAELDIAPPRVRAQLLSFVAAGVMRQLARVGQTVDYERIDDPFWKAVLLIAEDWE